MKKPWNHDYNTKAVYAILVGCVLIAFIFLMMNLSGVFSAMGTFLGIISPFLWGFAIAYILSSPLKFFETRVFGWLNRKKPRPRLINGLSVTLSILVFLAIIVGLVWIIFPNITNSVIMLIEAFPEYIRSFQETLQTLEDTYNLNLDFIQDLNISWSTIMTDIQQWLVATTPEIANVSWNLALDVVGGISDSIIALIVAIYVMISRNLFINSAKKLMFGLFPRKQATQILKGFRHTNKVFSKFITGKLLESLIVWAMTFLIMIIVMPENPYNLLISVLMAVFNIIPFFGPFIGAIPSLLILVVYNPTYALWFLIIVLVTQQIDGQIIGPKILGDSTGLMPFWVIFAIIVGGGLFGLLGMILGIPVFAVIYALVKHLLTNSLKKKGLSTDSKDYQNPIEEDNHIKQPRKKRQKSETYEGAGSDDAGDNAHNI